MFSIPAFALRQLFVANGQLRCIRRPVPVRFGCVEIMPFPKGAPAAASLSADFELAWAWRNLSPDGMEARARTERANVPRLLDLLARYRVPVTWATVGHLFLTSCQRDATGCVHPEMPRPGNNFGWSGDWYLHDPASDYIKAPGWYCPDLIRQIQESPVGHELGTHSFSHIDFGLDRSTPELVEAELNACREAMRPFGVHPRSLVYCFNHMGHQHLGLLARHGLTSVRHRDKRRMSYPVRSPDGVYLIYESMNLRFARWYDYSAKARAFLNQAQRTSTAFHIWFHPSDPWEVFSGVLAPILGLLARLRDQGLLAVATMRDLAAYCEGRATTELGVSSQSGRLIIEPRRALDTERFGTPTLTLSVPGTNRTQLNQVIGRCSVPVPAAACRPGRQPGTLLVDLPWDVERMEVVG